MTTETTSRQLVFIFDLGGVVTRWRNNDPIIRFVANRYGVPFDQMKQAMKKDLAEFERGRLSSRDYVANCLGRVGRALKTEDDADWLLSQKISRLARLRRGTVDVIKRLRRRGYKVYALSNISPPHLEIVKRRGWNTLFDEFFASCDLGAVKPDELVYRRVLEQVGAPAAEAVFVDDIEANVLGAAQAGIERSFRFTSVSQLRRDIAGVLRGT